MNSMKVILAIILLQQGLTNLSAQNSSYVNVFIGTQGTGHTFPGPSMPFGMVQPGPDNQDYGWDYTSGYQYLDTVLIGFSQTRLSGTGINELGDVLLLPINPELENASQRYFKESEIGKVGYYTLTKRDSVAVELTCTDRVAFHRYTFPGEKGQVLVDLQHGLRFVFDPATQKGLVLESEVSIENNTTISGYCSTSNWVNRKYFFTVTFDQPFSQRKKLEPGVTDNAPRFLLDFDLPENKQLQVKISLSTVSVEGAKRNLQQEVPHWNFDAVYESNLLAWNAYLSRIDIEAPRKQKEIFYTALYHLLLQPSNIADVDGQYRGADDRIAIAPNKEYYSTLSIWDVYRAAFPLLQILVPERIDGIVQTMLLHHKAAGFLPIWTVWGQDNYCMIGNHAIPMILSSYQNGFRGFDAHVALQAMVETSTISHINSDWELYNKYGYYPFDKLDNESVSRTLESGFDDWCVSQMAKSLGELGISQEFEKRARYFKNLFDPTCGFFRGRDVAGNWRNPFDPLLATSPLNNPGDYTEANAWQYFWTPAHYDHEGLAELLGGPAAFRDKLNAFFQTEAVNPNKFLGQEAMIGQYAHGNEPSHHIAYLYGYTDQPKTGQHYINNIIEKFHNNTPDGMIGNDDCGQMSAWYIFSTLGFYPVNPVNGTFVLGNPQVASARLNLPDGKAFQVMAHGFSGSAKFNERRWLNGVALSHPHITYTDLIKGGSLTFEMVED